MNPLRFDAERVARNVRQADTEDLLDRVTVYRQEMEPEAIPLIEAELRSRGVTAEDIDAHARRHEGRALARPEGTAEKCSFCHRPAVAEAWGWHRLGGLLPVFPRRFRYCAAHGGAVTPGAAVPRRPA
jgi:hypothetical protein